MNDLERQRLRRRIDSAVDEIDTMKAQLAEIRRCCAELSAAMREIRENSIKARSDAERKQKIKRVV